jgi:hypothetical protein
VTVAGRPGRGYLLSMAPARTPDAVGTPVEATTSAPDEKGKAPSPTGHGPLIPTVLSWPLFAVFPGFALPTWGWALWRAARRGRRSVLGAVLLSPFVAVSLLSAGQGLLGYVTGTAALRGKGMPGPGYSNLDRTLRCRQSSGGCVVTGHEPFTILPNNLVLLALGAVFGSMPGGYDGPYPTEEDAFLLLENAKPVAVRDGAREVVVAGHRLDAELLSLVDHGATPGPRLPGPPGAPDVRTYRLVVVEDRCLVAQDEADADEAVLVDVEGRRKIAWYGRRR